MDIATCTFSESGVVFTCRKSWFGCSRFIYLCDAEEEHLRLLDQKPPVCGFKGTAAHWCWMQEAEEKQACSGILEHVRDYCSSCKIKPVEHHLETEFISVSFCCMWFWCCAQCLQSVYNENLHWVL